MSKYNGNLSSEDEHRCCTSGCAPSGKYLKVLRKIKEAEILNRKGKYKKGQQGVSKESCLQCENENTTKKSALRNGNSSNLFHWKEGRILCHPRKQETLWLQVTVFHGISFANSFLCFGVLSSCTCTMTYDTICRAIG